MPEPKPFTPYADHDKVGFGLVEPLAGDERFSKEQIVYTTDGGSTKIVGRLLFQPGGDEQQWCLDAYAEGNIIPLGTPRRLEAAWYVRGWFGPRTKETPCPTP